MSSSRESDKLSSNTEIVSGFVCPECMHSFKNSELLINHFHTSHQKEITKDTKHKNSKTPKSPFKNIKSLTLKPVSESVTSEKVDFAGISGIANSDEYQNILIELSTHNSQLLERIESDQSRIGELEAVVNLILSQCPLPDWIRIQNEELKQKVNQYLDFQANLATNTSSVEALEAELNAKNEEIRVFQIQLNNMQIEESSEQFKIQELSDHFKTQIDQSIQTDLNIVASEENNDENDTLDKDCASLLNQLDSVKREFDTYKQQAAVNYTQLSDSKDLTISNLTNEHQTFKAVLESQLKVLKLTNKTLEDNLDKAHQTNRDLEIQLNDWPEKFGNLRVQSEQEMLKLKTELDDVTSRQLLAQSDRDRLQLQFDDCQKKLIDSEKVVNELQLELNSLKDRSKDNSELSQKELDSLIEKLISAEDLNVSLKKELEVKIHEIDELQAAVLDLGRENQTFQVMRERTSNRQWANDDTVMDCFLCNRPFSLSNRKHHCRNCGNIFCQMCSSKKCPISSSKDPVRVCDTCFIELNGSV